MPDPTTLPLEVVDGLTLRDPLRAALRPGDLVSDDQGQTCELPRYFYEIPSWDDAMRVQLAPSFGLWEFIQTDVRETEALRGFPRYVPCAITLVALGLERFRQAAGTYVHIAANGGYRSPSHSANRGPTTHCWASAVNIYQIGDVALDTRDAIERFGSLARATMPGAWTRPFGTTIGATTDQLHIDFGYLLAVPHEATSVATPGDSP